MRVLLITDYGTPTGGVELTTCQLRDGLARRGHDARWFASTADTGGGASTADYHCFGTTSPFRTLVQSVNPMAARSLSRVIVEFRPDVVHVGMFLTQLSPLILPPLRRVPTVYFAQWYRVICPVGTKLLPDTSPCNVPYGGVCYRSGCLPLRDFVPLMVQMKLWRRWAGAFDAFVANSNAIKAKLAAEGIQCQDVVYSGVPHRTQRPRVTFPPTVAYAGRLVPAKGVDLLIRAVAHCHTIGGVPDARLVIVGDGPQRAALERMVDDLKMRGCVEFTGHLSRARVDEVLATAWVQAAPSIWAEPFGLVAPEAMMRGTAIVATTGGGMTETVDDGRCGFLVPPGEVAPLADALGKILRDREVAERFGAFGREVAIRRFSVDVMVEHFERIYGRLLGTPAKAPSSSGVA